jgi:DNA-binding response OmpR family regulator
LLIVNKEGINKKFLYESIWPNDKDISINKLDTHLTNLKNQIKLDLSLNINFISQEKILNLIIN